MIPRRNPYANISLAPPETIQANFGEPGPMNVPQIPMEGGDTGEQIAGLGQSIMGLKKRFGGAQGEMIKGALSGGTGGKA